MKLDFRDGAENFTDLEREYAEYLLSGVELTGPELKVKFGPAMESLRDNLDIRRYVADQKIARKSKKALVDQMHIEKFVKAVPLALKTILEAMKSDNASDRRWAASLIAKPVLSQLEKMSINAADLEFTFDQHGNAIKIDAEDKSVL